MLARFAFALLVFVSFRSAPIAAAEPNSEQGRLYAQIAGKLASTLAVQAWRDKPQDAVGQGFFGPRG